MKKKRKSGILNRARKTRAAKGPSPLSSPLQGEGKIGEEEIKEGNTGDGEKKIGEGVEAHPVRVPIEPTNRRRHKISRLPPDLKEGLDRMLGEGRMHTCRQLAKWLGDNGYQISHSSIHKYGRKFERRLEAIRMATEQARLVCEQFKDDDEQMQSALMRLVQTNLFEVLTAVKEARNGIAEEEEESAPVVPVNITAIARSVSGLARAETEHRKWAARARAGVAEAGKKVEEARAKGLSQDAAEQIKSVLLGIS